MAEQGAPRRGSMAPPNIEGQIRQQREAEGLEDKVKEAARERVEAQAQEREEKINAHLPAKVESGIYNIVDYADFKHLYASVWDQIASKDHLLTSRVVIEDKLGQTPIVVQSLKRREESALSAYEPSPVGYRTVVRGEDGTAREHTVSPQERAEQNIEYMTRRMIVQIQRLGAATFPDITLTPDTRKAWEEDTTVQQAAEYLYDLDPMFFQHLVFLVNDLDQAKHFALVENMKNPLAQRSPTTDSSR